MRRLGDSDLAVTPLALGANVFGWTADEPTSHRTLDAFLDGGGNLIDTADAYSAWADGNVGGESERIIGSWLARTGRRDDVVIATKVSRHPQLRGLSAENIAKAVQASLDRLGTERIDLYFAHYDDESVPLEETLGAFDSLITQGTIRYYGLSNYTPERIHAVLETVRTHRLRPPVCLQPQYNLLEREPYETGYAPIAAKEQLAVLPYYALASGFLTGKYDRNSVTAGLQRGPAVSRYMTDRGFAVIDALRDVAAGHSTSVTAAGLAWLLAQPTVTAPIASASKPEQVADLLEATGLELSPDELVALDQASES